MNTRLSLFLVAHALFTVSHSLADADRHDTINSRLSHANKQSESLRQLIREQQRIIRNQGAALQADDAVLGDRIESVKDDLVSVRAEVELSQDALMEKSEDIEHVVARVSDMEIAVGMPGTDVVIEPSVDLVQPSHTYQNCRVAFRTINWAEFRDWTMRQIKRGTTCRTLSAHLVAEGLVQGEQAFGVCEALFPELPWSDHKRRVQRWSRKNPDCNTLADMLRKRTQR